jgi:hypothetical protein
MRSGFASLGSGLFAMLGTLVTLLACDANLGSVAATSNGESESESEGDGPTTTGSDEPVACIGGELCPGGTSCSNGVCETDCSDDGDCDDDEFCGLDGLCHANTVPGCSSDQDCAATQTCVNQICTAPGNGSCDLDNYLQDGCPSNAVCFEHPNRAEQGVCYPMQACAGDQSCPIGLGGAVCNTGQLPNKDEICLVGFCDVVANCPDLWSCVRFDNSVLGLCSDGGFGSPCSLDVHCLSASCAVLPGLGGGFCG